jgi:hypothetical protein
MIDLKIGLSENSVLTAFHKDAKTAYDSGKNLYYICHELMHSSAKFNDEVKQSMPNIICYLLCFSIYPYSILSNHNAE